MNPEYLILIGASISLAVVICLASKIKADAIWRCKKCGEIRWLHETVLIEYKKGKCLKCMEGEDMTL